MNIDDIHKALDAADADTALVRRFLSVWPSIELMLETFSKATGLPIFVFLNRVKVFQSANLTLPPFCALMLGNPNTESVCTEDALRRAEGDEPEFMEGLQHCHAGLVTGRRQLDTGCVGVMSILYGAWPSTDQIGRERKEKLIQATRLQMPALATSLEAADATARCEKPIRESDTALINAIVNILNQLLRATVDIHSLTINLTHELSVIMLGLGLLATEVKGAIDEARQSNPEGPLREIFMAQSHFLTECQVALFTIRNFLSHVSETRYSQVTKPQFVPVNLRSLLLDMVDLYKRLASTKQISFDLSGLPDLPRIWGAEMELRRLFHNILSNAVKYSYHSIPYRERTIRIRAKVPYDPGFRQRRFAIVFENYGLGITEAEKRRVFDSGFRGKQAVAEVPIGAGIGLSEALKIMRVHGGEIKFGSRPLHKQQKDETYLTTVELLFPFVAKS